MINKPEITLVSMEGTTLFAPLVALGFYVREQDLLSPIFSRLKFDEESLNRTKPHTVHPEAAILEVWISILAGCRSISQVNTRIRPDRVLAQAWGMECFYEQSTLARVLDICQAVQVNEMRCGVEGIYRWIGRAPQLAWAGPLTVDIDLTAMLAGRRAEGSTKGYFPEKRGPTVGSCAASAPPTMTKASPPYYFRVIC